MNKISHTLSLKRTTLVTALLLSLSACQLVPQQLVEGTSAFEFEEINGRVLVIRDSNYAVATPSYQLDVGDRVISMDDAEALINFTITDEDGKELASPCQLRLPSAAQITLQSYNDCHSDDTIVLNNTTGSES